jgi:cholesterol transport system auxiliary component
MAMRTLMLLPLFLLAACGGNVREAERATYDLGMAAVVWKPHKIAIDAVSVQAPSWLATPSIAYRLLYAGGAERRSYGESRWVAPPAELIERALNRQTSAVGGCRLRLDVDDLIQVFDSPQASRVLLDVRASLLTPQGETILARRAFSVMQATSSPDARGGVAAAATATQALGSELRTWLTEIAETKPAVAHRCSAVN